MSTLDALFRGAVATWPARVAVVDSRGDTSYAELDHHVEQLARHYLASGVAPGDRVAIQAEKSAMVVAAMLACYRIAAVAVPIDPGSPPLRVAQVFADASPKLWVTTSSRADAAERFAPAILRLDAPLPAPAVPLGAHPPSGEDLAYILYTSGSTGTPKGVAIRHHNARAFVDWAVAATDLSAEDRVSSHAPFHFDLSVFDLYASFAVGAAVVLVPEGSSFAPAQLVDLILTQQITVWYSVPSVLVLMMEHADLLGISCPFRVLIFAGEVFPIRHLRRFRDAWPTVRFWNWYGPTETNVCTAYEQTGPIAPGVEAPLPIGAACAGDTAWAITDDGRVAEIGEEGELFVDGPTVMAGYFGRPPQVGPYPTGDRVRVLAEGGYAYLGRRDHLIKVRGHRIELGDIEAALLSHPGLAEAVVGVLGVESEAKIVAWCVATGAPVPLLHLKKHCADRLPRYMIIDRVVWLDTLPRTANGKVDRLSLRQRG